MVNPIDDLEHHGSIADLRMGDQKVLKIQISRFLSLVLLLISNLTNGLRLHQFLVTKPAEANKSIKTDANRAH